MAFANHIPFNQVYNGDFKGFVKHLDENEHKRREQGTLIAQEYDYHRMFDPPDDEIICSCEGYIPGEDCEIHSKMLDPQHISVLLEAQPLLKSVDEGGAGCENSDSGNREGYWASDPAVSAAGRSSFLDQIAYLCFRSELRSCKNQACQDHKIFVDRAAPKCDWADFREWAVTAMTCQDVLARQNFPGRGELSGKLSLRGKGHTHIARAVAGCCMALSQCIQHGFSNHVTPFQGEDADSEEAVLHKNIVNGVINIIYWMAKIQYEKDIGPSRFGRWGSELLPLTVASKTLNEKVLRVMEEKDWLCQKRFWDLVGISDRRQNDLPDLLEAVEGLKEFWLRKQNHGRCVASRCQTTHLIELDEIRMVHKCPDPDSPCVETMTLPRDSPSEVEWARLVNRAVEKQTPTAWLLDGSRMLRDPEKEPYMAISHVWADGTGWDSEFKSGEIRRCLFDFWEGVAGMLNEDANMGFDLPLKGIWWDTISVPADKEMRKRAISTMHDNYRDAAVTVVHDSGLLEVPWTDDGTPCIAVVLSTWFTRGWTALELAMSPRVVVLFKNPEGGDERGRSYVAKDLDRDILSHSPATSSRAWWLASTWIRRMRRPINDVGDILSILGSRSTSKPGDRPIIAALLAKVRDVINLADKSEATLTEEIIRFLGRVPQNALLHGKPTIGNEGQPWDWCPASLDDMPAEIVADMESQRASEIVNTIDVSDDGAVDGEWWCSMIEEADRNRIHPYGDDLLNDTKVKLALEDWERCLILRIPASSKEDAAILVRPMSTQKRQESGEQDPEDEQEAQVQDVGGDEVQEGDGNAAKDPRVWVCQYVGAVLDERGTRPPRSGSRTDWQPDKPKGWHFLRLKMGVESSNLARLSGLQMMHDAHGLDPSKWGMKRCKSCRGEGSEEQDGLAGIDFSDDLEADRLEDPYYQGEEIDLENLARAIIRGKPGAVIHAANRCFIRAQDDHEDQEVHEDLEDLKAQEDPEAQEEPEAQEDQQAGGGRKGLELFDINMIGGGSKIERLGGLWTLGDIHMQREDFSLAKDTFSYAETAYEKMDVYKSSEDVTPQVLCYNRHMASILGERGFDDDSIVAAWTELEKIRKKCIDHIRTSLEPRQYKMVMARRYGGSLNEWQTSSEVWDHLHWQALTGQVMLRFSQLDQSHSDLNDEAVSLWKGLLEHVLGIDSAPMPSFDGAAGERKLSQVRPDSVYSKVCDKAVRRLQVHLPANHPLVSVAKFMRGSHLMRWEGSLDAQRRAKKDMRSVLKGLEENLKPWQSEEGEHWFVAMARRLLQKIDATIEIILGEF